MPGKPKLYAHRVKILKYVKVGDAWLQTIAQKRGLSTKLVGIVALTRALTSANALSTELVADLRTASAVLNSAVHGQNIEAEETQSALELGNSLLSRLEGSD